MKFRFTRLTVLMLAAVMVLGLAACSSPSASPTPTQAPTQAPAQGTTDPQTPATPETVDYLAKYEPEINLTAWRFLNAGIQFEPGESIEDNVYMRAYKEDLGINLSYVWTVPQEQFEQKLNISIASGDLPDIMWLNNKQLIELSENGLLYDLTDLFLTKTSPETQAIMQQDQASFDTAKIGGRLMALPNTGSAIDSLQLLFIRSDWLENLGLSMPTNMEELLAVSEAFTNKDPDGNGQNDTIGLALTKNFIKDNHAGATGFVAGYHGYLRRWIKDAEGKLVYGSVQPEVKDALQALQNMYAAGQLDKEFGVKDRAKVTETIASSKVGITYGGMSTPGAFLKESVLNDENADWAILPLLSVDDKPAAPIAKMPVERYYGVSAESEHPEAIMKLIEFGTKGYTRDGQSEEENKKFGITESGIATFQYAIVYYEPARKNLDAHYNVLKAHETNDTSILNAEEMGYYEKFTKFLAGDRSQWGEAHIFGTPSSFDVIGEYVDKENYIYNEFYGSMTPTMVEKNATLEAMEEEVFTKIIMGQSIDSFDKFVEDWNKLGGQQITEEVNAWAASRE